MASILLRLESKHLDFRTLDKSVDQQPLLVIGVGLGRTGTMSLRKALQILYDKPCYHLFEVILRHQDHIPKWIKILRQCREGLLDSIDPDELKDLFKGYATADSNLPCAVYEKLIEIYPDAKVILTTRDSRKWLASFRETFGQSIFQPDTWSWNKFTDNFAYGLEFKQMATLSMQCSLGWNLDFSNDRAVIQAYETRNQHIIRCIPPERLLCFNVKDGWEPLCRFLNQPIPDEQFPHINDRAELQLRLKRVEHIKVIVTWSLPILIIAVIGLLINHVILS